MGEPGCFPEEARSILMLFQTSKCVQLESSVHLRIGYDAGTQFIWTLLPCQHANEATTRELHQPVPPNASA